MVWLFRIVRFIGITGFGARLVASIGIIRYGVSLGWVAVVIPAMLVALIVFGWVVSILLMSWFVFMLLAYLVCCAFGTVDVLFDKALLLFLAHLFGGVLDNQAGSSLAKAVQEFFHFFGMYAPELAQEPAQSLLHDLFLILHHRLYKVQEFLGISSFAQPGHRYRYCSAGPFAGGQTPICKGIQFYQLELQNTGVSFVLITSV